jgi:hypothetical protein
MYLLLTAFIKITQVLSGELMDFTLKAPEGQMGNSE